LIVTTKRRTLRFSGELTQQPLEATYCESAPSACSAACLDSTRLFNDRLSDRLDRFPLHPTSIFKQENICAHDYSCVQTITFFYQKTLIALANELKTDIIAVLSF
jgi:hypothetical protein